MSIHRPYIIGYDVKDKKDLFIHSAIKYFGVGLIGIFLPALLFQHYGRPLHIVFLFFSIASIVVVVTHIVATGKIISQYGTKIGMIIGIFLLSLFFLSIQFLSNDYVAIPSFISAMLLGTFTAFFRGSYNYDMSEYAKTDHFGSKMATLNIIITISSAIAPILGGLIIDKRGLTANIVVATSILILSMFPLIQSHQKHKKRTYNNAKMLQMLKKPKERKIFIAFAALSYYKTVSIIIWPLVIFMLVGSYTKLGAINTITIIMTIITIYIIGKYMDKDKDRQILKTALFFESVNRMSASITLALSLFTNAIIVILDIIHSISSKSTETTLHKNMFTHAFREKIDPIYVIIERELSHHVTKAIALLLISILFYMFPYTEILIIPMILMVLTIPLQYMLFWEK